LILAGCVLAIAGVGLALITILTFRRRLEGSAVYHPAADYMHIRVPNGAGSQFWRGPMLDVARFRRNTPTHRLLVEHFLFLEDVLRILKSEDSPLFVECSSLIWALSTFVFWHEDDNEILRRLIVRDARGLEAKPELAHE